MSGNGPALEPRDDKNQQGSTPRPVGHSLTDEEVSADVAMMKVLANPTRYQALRSIAEADEAVCGCELEPTLGVSQGAVSQALSRLDDVGLVERRKDGRWRYYSATPAANRMLGMFDETRDVRRHEA